MSVMRHKYRLHNRHKETGAKIEPLLVRRMTKNMLRDCLC